MYLICQSPRQSILPKFSLSSLASLETETANDVDLETTRSEAAGSNAGDPSWLELVPWRNKQLATEIGAAVLEPSNCISGMNVMFRPEKREREKRGQGEKGE